eukprot:scaffold15732_cov137-Isochrysis_galbana.AAC.2
MARVAPDVDCTSVQALQGLYGRDLPPELIAEIQGIQGRCVRRRPTALPWCGTSRPTGRPVPRGRLVCGVFDPPMEGAVLGTGSSLLTPSADCSHGRVLLPP